MKKINLIIFLIFIFSINVFSNEKDIEEIKIIKDMNKNEILEYLNLNTGKEIKLKGKLRIVGSAFRKSFVITLNDMQDIYIDFKVSEEKKRLYPYQGKEIEIIGILNSQEMKYRNPKYNYLKYSIEIKKLYYEVSEKF